MDEAHISVEDERALAAFMAPDHEQFKQKSLKDLLISRIKEKQHEAGLPR